MNTTELDRNQKIISAVLPFAEPLLDQLKQYCRR